MTALRRLRPIVVAALLGGVLLAPAGAGAASADVDDFGYSSWDARYELSLDADGGAVLQAREHVVADFPDVDQNRGIVRGYALRYEGAPLRTRIVSVTDASGAAIPYETEEDDGTLFVLTGDDDYVHGPTDYVISYEMRNVMHTADDTGHDEFYWDLLPLDSTQDIERFRAEIVVDDALAEHLDGAVACYQGASGSTRPCELAGPDPVDGAVAFTVQSGHRDAGDGVTVALGFEPGTVTQPQARQAAPLLDAGPAVGGVGAVALGIGAWIAVGAHRRRRRTATGIVVAQYDVPSDLPPLLAAPLIPGAKSPIAAEIVHLAVRGSLRIEDRGDEPPVLHRGDAATEDALDASAMKAIFRKHDRATIPRSSEGFAGRMQKLELRGTRAAARRGLTTRERAPLAGVFVLASIVVLVAAIVLVSVAGAQGRDSLVGGIIAVGIAGVVVIAAAVYAFTKHTVLTRAGAERHEYLQGVREFIRVAEADRLRMLQSYSGAERYTDGGLELIHLYERLLPYAILFGMEREWADVLETRYAGSAYEPSWASGYRAGFFAGYLTQFGSTAQAAAHYSAPSTSSSSSSAGSFGGGFSGGGGGGGFSGGR